MKKDVFKRHPLFIVFSGIAPALVTIAAIAMVSFGLNQAESSANSEGRKLLEDGIRRAVITCYAIEGSYPESIEYISEHYGVLIDKNKYVVHYDIFASNIMPDITIIELK